MTQRTIVLTGASDGIGAAAARQLAGANRLILVGRSPEKTARVAGSVGAEYLIADFARLAEVRRLASDIQKRIGRIDVLANNAGGIFGDRTITEDGHEKTFQVNHLAAFLLTMLLLERLRQGEGVVVNTSSVASRAFGRIDLDDLDNQRHYSPQKAYGDSKLANILFTKGLHAHFHADGINSVALHPGGVATNFASDTTSVMRFVYHTPLSRFALITPDKGAENLTWAINGIPGVTWQSGEYYELKRLPRRVNRQQNDPALVEAFWKRSAELVGIPV